MTRAMLFLVLGLVSHAIAHADDHGHGGSSTTSVRMDIQMGANDGVPGADSPQSYFGHPDNKPYIYAHIALMVLSWVFALPTAVMLSLARSWHTLLAQFVFLAGNAIGLALGVIYNAKTPDLYPNNAHHKMGWIVTIIVAFQVFLHLLDRTTGFMAKSGPDSGSYRELRSLLTSRMSTTRRPRRDSDMQAPHRLSYDSGHGSDRLTESLRSSSGSASVEDRRSGHEESGFDHEDAYTDVEFLAPKPRPHRWHGWVSKVPMGPFRRGARAFAMWYSIIDRVILPLGFTTLCTGITTFGRFFEGQTIFSGLAHWIKGGIFFWLGIFTLGRWSGAMGNLGWAWNITPKKGSRKWRPSAELVESALIFIYGSTNIFLEHLGGWGGAWTSSDLQHIAITVLFIGGGLCGMLVESAKIRDLLNTTTVSEASYPDEPGESGSETVHIDAEKGILEETPDHYGFSMNPIPALVIILLGTLMSSHHQKSEVSTMIHKRWGDLLMGAGLARGFTYVLMYLKPPKSILPSRPPTELLASFGLMSGGIIFMASSSDTVASLEKQGLDAMFIYTITMGLIGALMAWVLFLLAFKGWAVRREAARVDRSQRLA